MNGIYKYKENQPVVWFHKNKAKSNQWCIYCGNFLGEGSDRESNKEHLIAREFVPKGTMGDKAFNLIFRACTECNSKKANVERHISSTTMINSRACAENEEIQKIAKNKAEKDFHPDNPGKSVIESIGENKINLGNIMQFGFISPPQVNQNYIKELSFRHIQGLFSLVTTKNPLVCEQTRLLPPNQFFFFGAYNEQDWGNPQILEVIDRTEKWMCHCNLETADGFFKATLKSSKEDGWFWALEWNKYLRIIGGIFNSGKLQNLFSGLPDPGWKDLGMSGNVRTRCREETPLTAEDKLFTEKCT